MVWKLFYDERPWTTNKDRNLHPMARAKLIKRWRVKFCELAQEAGIPELESMAIEAVPWTPKRVFADLTAHNPAVKAAIDGIVDAGVIPDDNNQWLKSVKFFPDEYHKGEPGLLIRVIGTPKVK